ncbi:MAG: hypothetical protein ASARMPRED_003145 [Alectoria sarmentosa]|nr:MAG: hypothetical protein ASARMPRED_003145 [Alectoria sarmentosa]
MLALALTADLTGVTDLLPLDTPDEPYFYTFKRESTATIKNPPLAYTHASPPKKQNVIEFDCRGLEFTEFKSDGEWQAKGLESPTKFLGIDLQEGEWFDYDEKAGEEVSIKDLTWEIRRA